MARNDKKPVTKENDSGKSEIYEKFKRSPALYIGSVVILVLVTVTFIGGDILSGRSGGNVADLTFGFYDKEPITWIPGNMFAQNREQAMRFYQSQGMDMDNFGVQAQIWRQSYEATVVHTAILQMMKRSNYSIPEKAVDRQVAQLPQFQDNGRFSSALYNQLSESARLAIWRQVQDELIKMNYFNDYLYGLLVPSAEADFFGRMSSVMRSFELVSFPVDAFPETEYLTYARQNANLFRTIHLSKITINTNEREARRVLDSIKNGTSTFEDAARAQSQDGYADRGGDIGSRYTFDLEIEIPNSAVRENIFNLRRGELSDVISVGESWVFFRIEEELKQANFDDFSTMDRVRSYLRNFDRGRMEDWALERAAEFISDVNASGFDDAVEWHNLEKQAFGPVPINYGGVDLFTSLESFNVPGIDMQNLINNENFWRIAFRTQLNNPSQPFVQGGNVIVLFPTEQVYEEPAAVENISSMYSAYWASFVAERFIHSYFLNNSRMDDRFWETYFRFCMP